MPLGINKLISVAVRASALAKSPAAASVKKAVVAAAQNKDIKVVVDNVKTRSRDTAQRIIPIVQRGVSKGASGVSKTFDAVATRIDGVVPPGKETPEVADPPEV